MCLYFYIFIFVLLLFVFMYKQRIMKKSKILVKINERIIIHIKRIENLIIKIFNNKKELL